MNPELAEIVAEITSVVHEPFDSNANPGTKAYVCGFLFCGEYVALIEKNRPVWQAGKLNGIGGKVEDGESPLEAMHREFVEEAGIAGLNWRLFATLAHDNNIVAMFEARTDSAELHQGTDEKVSWWHISEIPRLSTVGNLKWLIPLAMSGSKEVAVVFDPNEIDEVLDA